MPFSSFEVFVLIDCRTPPPLCVSNPIGKHRSLGFSVVTKGVYAQGGDFKTAKEGRIHTFCPVTSALYFC